jgi:UDP-N-acetylglucosamine transferase subunit ALG13
MNTKLQFLQVYLNKIYLFMQQKSVLISPLDWGLGHATRCIPIIAALQELGYRVTIATDGPHEIILREAFPGLTFLTLKGYGIRYSKSANGFAIKMLIQVPRILYNIFREFLWCRKTNRLHQFDLIISDNRLGFFHFKTTSIFITHQLNLQTPFAWTTRLLQWMQYTWFQLFFTMVWVPDMEGVQNLSGILGNPTRKPSTPIWYMNILSRLKDQMSIRSANQVVDQAAPLLFLGIVSGPEPQRSIFQEILWKEGNQMNQPFQIVAGTANQPKNQAVSANGSIVPHLSGPELAKAIENATYIISRGGYTSLMELIPFGKKLILVPTPGQTEQEYLAKRWQEKGWAIAYDQTDFNLATALEKAAAFNFQPIPFKSFSKEALKETLKQVNL